MAEDARDLGSFGLWVAGERVRTSAGPQRTVVDPARGQIIAEVPEATVEEAAAAVAAARRAFDRGPWRDLTPAARAEVLLRFAQRIREHADELARLESLNVGRPIREARSDPLGAAAHFDACARAAARMHDEVLEGDPRKLTLVVREPLGVVAAIVPWNYPLDTAAALVAGPLAAGNAVVLKPSSLTPLTALRLGELAADLFPLGVLNVITGAGESIGAQLAASPGVDGITLTGSTATGAELMRLAAPGMKRLTLELGGKSPTIVLDDAPLGPSVAAALRRATINSGQNCAAGTRLLVHRSRRDEFVAALIAAAAQLSMGDPQDEGTDLGPLISAGQRERVRRYMDVARDEATLLYRSPVPDDPALVRGFFVPVSFWDAGPGTRLWREEVFGPMLAVTAFDDDDEAVALANDSDYGLLATVWSADRERALRVARRVRCGVVRVNGATSQPGAPWGGFGASGIGRIYGRFGIEASTEIKQISVEAV